MKMICNRTKWCRIKNCIHGIGHNTETTCDDSYCSVEKKAARCLSVEDGAIRRLGKKIFNIEKYKDRKKK